MSLAPGRYFHSGMSGAPQLTPATASGLAIIRACLVDGFGSITPDAMVVSSGVATLTKSTGHNLGLINDFGSVITVSGVTTPPELSGNWRVFSSPTSTTLTFLCPGVPDGTATGTPSVKRASAGWTLVAEDANKLLLRRPNAGCSPYDLRIADTVADWWNWQTVYGATGLADGTVEISTSPSKIYQNTPASVAWYLVATDIGVIFGWKMYTNIGRDAYLTKIWTDYASFLLSNPYNLVHGSEYQTILRMNYAAQASLTLPRQLNGATPSLSAQLLGHQTGYPGSSTLTQMLEPGTYVTWPFLLGRSSDAFPVGRVPGLYGPFIHRYYCPLDGTIVPFAGGKYMLVRDAYVEDSSWQYKGKVFIDIMGPWL